MEPFASLWQWLGTIGGGVALAFIVALALGIVSLTAFYIGSAVVVLERFARIVSRWRWVVVFGLLMALSLFLYLVLSRLPELGELAAVEAVTAPSWGALGAASLLVTISAIAICWGLLRWLAPARLGVLSLVVFGLAALLTLAPAELLFSPNASMQLALFGGMLLQALLGLVAFGLLPLAAAGFVESSGSVEWFIAIRYLVAKRRQVFISAITGICVVGIAAGVWLIITVLSVMNGFETTWRDEILGNRAHFTVHRFGGPIEDRDHVLEVVRSVPGVVAASPYLDADGMVRGADGGIFSVRVRGVDPASVGDVTDLRDDLIAGVPGGSGSKPGLGAWNVRGPRARNIDREQARVVGTGCGRGSAPAGGPLWRPAHSARAGPAPRTLPGRRGLRIELLPVR